MTARVYSIDGTCECGHPKVWHHKGGPMNGKRPCEKCDCPRFMLAEVQELFPTVDYKRPGTEDTAQGTLL